MKSLLISFIFLLTYSAQAQNKNIHKEKWHWGSELEQDTATGYAQVVKVGNVLYISGVVTREVTPENVSRLYQALQASLEEFGASFQNVVKENLYTTDMEAMKKCNYVRKKFYSGDFPAATWVQVDRLFMPEAKLEVELVAHLPE